MRIIRFTVCVFLLAACSKQEKPTLMLDPQNLHADGSGSTLTFSVKSNTLWSLSGVPDYIQATPSSGNGDRVVSLVIDSNPSRESRNAKITVTAENLQQTLSVNQSGNTTNTPPSIPVLIAPEENATNLSVMPIFSWHPSSDANGDNVTYTLSYTSSLNWTSIDCGANTSISLDLPLTGSTTYRWKVAASDGYGEGVESEVREFSTGISMYREEKEVRILMENRPVNGVNLVFLCDGFNAQDLLIDGVCDQRAEEALNYFFDIEPYKSYREYFNAYLVYSYSIDRGASYGAVNTVKNTSFSVACSKDSRSATSMTCDTAKVFRYAKLAKTPAISINETLIILLSQDDRYAGTCWMWATQADRGGGKAIAITTTSSNSYPYNFKGALQHEAGGHGFAKLADEYINATTAKDADKNAVNAWYVKYGFYPNVDLTNNLSIIRWSEFIGLPGYDAVGAYEGGYYFSTGVWRPESVSCMINNIAYHNAPSRAAIVRRIKKIAKEEFRFDEFLAKDLVKTPDHSIPSLFTKSQDYPPLAPPVIIEE